MHLKKRKPTTYFSLNQFIFFFDEKLAKSKTLANLEIHTMYKYICINSYWNNHWFFIKREWCDQEIINPDSPCWKYWKWLIMIDIASFYWELHPILFSCLILIPYEIFNKLLRVSFPREFFLYNFFSTSSLFKNI